MVFWPNMSIMPIKNQVSFFHLLFILLIFNLFSLESIRCVEINFMKNLFKQGSEVI